MISVGKEPTLERQSRFPSKFEYFFSTLIEQIK